MRTGDRCRTVWVAMLIAALSALGLANPVTAQAALNAPGNPGPADSSVVTQNPVLSWGSVTDASSYLVQIATDTGFSALRYEAEVVAPTAAPKVDLTPGTYYWRVMPLDSAGTGSYGPTWSFLRDTRSGPTLSSPSDGQIIDFPEFAPLLRWEPLASATGYEVQWSTSDTFPVGSSTSSKAVSSTAYTLTSLLAQDRFTYWRVRGIYKTSSGKTSSTTTKTEWSATRSFSTDWEDGGATNSTPALLTPANDSASSSAVTHPRFAWTPVAGAPEYRLQISAAPDFTDIRIDTQLARAEYTGRGSLLAGAYYWRVAALDANESQGPWSEVWEFYRGWVDDGQPVRPTVTAADEDENTTGIQMTRDRFLLTWTAIPGASHYEVQIADHSTFTNTSASRMITCKTPNTAVTSVSSGSYRRSSALSACLFQATSTFDIDDESVVYARVRAIDKTTGAHPGGSAVSEVATLWSDQSRSEGDPAPGPVTINLSATPTGGIQAVPAVQTAPDTGSVHTGTPVLAWDRIPGATRYLVALSTDSSFTNSELGDGNASDDYYVVTGTRLAMPVALKDNTAGQSLYWYVLPCSVWLTTGNAQNECPVPDSAAINQTGKYRSFRKVAPSPADLSPTATGDVLPQVTSDVVMLDWSDVFDTEADGVAPHKELAGTRHYEVEVSTDPDFTELGQRVLLTTTDATELVPEIGWDLSETYYWRVRAVDGGGSNNSWSGTGSFVYASIEGASETVTSVASKPHPTLTWSAIQGAAAYEVEVYSGEDPTYPQANRVSSVTAAYVAWSPPTATSLSPPTPLPTGEYSWRVRRLDAFDAAGPWSESLDESSPGDQGFTVGAVEPSLSTPAASATTTMRGLSFSWSAVAGAAEYVVQVSPTADFAAVGSTYTVTTSNTSWTPTTGMDGYPAGTYFWRVQAISTATTGKVLATSQVRGFTLTTPPGVVAGVTAASSSRGSAVVSWTRRPANDGGAATTAYRLWSKATGGSWVEILPASPGNAASRTLSGLRDGSEYELRVAAVSSAGTGAFSKSAKVTTPGAPGAPRSLSVTAIDRGFTAKWSAPTSVLPVLGYTLRFRPTGTAAWTAVGVSGTTLTKKALLPNRRYEIQLFARNAVGAGPIATYSGGLLTKAAPSAPRSLRLSAIKGGAKLTWLAPALPGSSAVTGYTVAYRLAATPTWRLRTLSKVTTTTLTALSKGKKYQVFVTAKNATSGVGAPTPTMVFTSK